MRQLPLLALLTALTLLLPVLRPLPPTFVPSSVVCPCYPARVLADR